MATGIVKWFDAETGFGFITPDEPDTTPRSSAAATARSTRAPGERFAVNRRALLKPGEVAAHLVTVKPGGET